MRKKLTFVVTAAVVLGLLGVQLLVSHKLSTLGGQLREMETQIEHLDLENELLQREIATSSSLMTIAKKASKLGFRNPTFLYLEIPAVALRK